MSNCIPSWPPSLSDAQRDELTDLGTNYALARGLLFAGAEQHAPLATALHAPFALLPSPFPRSLFEEAQRLQPLYNLLYARVCTDFDFLESVLGDSEQGVSRADPFVAQLWQIYKAVRAEGIAQPLHLGLVRSDYLLHQSAPGEPLAMRQVEFNTIGCAFGPHSQIVGALHKYLHATTHFYHASPILDPANFPSNYTIPGLGSGMADAHSAYGHPHACILFIVSEQENNIFDQRWLEYELIEKHEIRVVRQTFDQLLTSASLAPGSRALHVQLATHAVPLEISVVYLRAGWAPESYPTHAHFALRALLERSAAIKCPSLPLQLAGAKKVQQVLGAPGVLERFLPAAPEDVAALRATFAGMWGLHEYAAAGHNRDVVLKPQREGGGNNVYGADVAPFIARLPAAEQDAWIAMETIAAPRNGAWLVRAQGERVRRADCVSELGIFGVMLFAEREGAVHMVSDREAGYLLRTKDAADNEGGVGVGFSVLDSIVLVDG